MDRRGRSLAVKRRTEKTAGQTPQFQVRRRRLPPSHQERTGALNPEGGARTRRGEASVEGTRVRGEAGRVRKGGASTEGAGEERGGAEAGASRSRLGLRLVLRCCAK